MSHRNPTAPPAVPGSGVVAVMPGALQVDVDPGNAPIRRIEVSDVIALESLNDGKGLRTVFVLADESEVSVAEAYRDVSGKYDEARGEQ